MVQVGGKTKKTAKAAQPQFVVESGFGTNEFLKFTGVIDGALHITWIGDANAATQFGSKFAAKSRIRDLEGILVGRVIKELI